MILANQQIAIHIKLVRNLSNYTSGRFALRFSIYQQSKQGRIYATPMNLIEKQPSLNDNRPQNDERYYISKAFPIKSANNVEINEICVFKHSLDVYGNQYDYKETIMNLSCELIHLEHNKHRIISSYVGVIRGINIHDALHIDFYELAPCQIVGSFHSCVYKYQFKHQNSTIDVKNYLMKYAGMNEYAIVKYLDEEGKKGYAKLKEVFDKWFKFDLKIQKVKKIQSLKEIDIAQRQTELDEDVRGHITQYYIPELKSKRRKIFEVVTKSESSHSKHDEIEKKLHQTAQKIYQKWRSLISLLFEIQGDKFIKDSESVFVQRLKKKIGESICRFKGSWDCDIYHGEQKQRNQMAYQLRNQQLYKQFDSNEFNIYNQDFFSKKRPIFFQESARKYQNGQINKQNQKQIFVILVHGLGACRLDMQKLRVELRRYYDSRIKIYASSSNQGRTEGDIDAMGMRLASEIQYQLSKYSQTPKICLMGHSMGGLIIRSALPRLEKYKNHFHSFITFSSPHLGYSYSTSKLVDAGLWILNTWKKCTSILQLTMQDQQNIHDCFLYKLSRKNGLQWFKKIVFLASHQDLYVPFYSARIQKHEDSNIDQKKGVKKGIIYNSMIDNILQQVQGSIVRLDVNFCIPEQNLDNLIGRAAHISFITNAQMVRTFVLSSENLIF